MFKKIIKLILCLIGLVTFLGSIYYFFSKKKKAPAPDEEQNFKEDFVEDTDFFDLSNLKFSRHYVDLR